MEELHGADALQQQRALADARVARRSVDRQTYRRNNTVSEITGRDPKGKEGKAH